MTQAVATYEQYEADFRELQEARSSDPEWLKELRNAAFDRFQEIGFPVARKGNELWKYTDVRRLAAETFPQQTGAAVSVDAAQLFPFDGGMARVAFVNGRFSQELSTPSPGRLWRSAARTYSVTSLSTRCTPTKGSPR